MKTFAAFLDELQGRLEKLPPRHPLAFSASCCERVFPNYEVFSEQEEWGDPICLRRALDYVWECAAGKDDAATARSLINDCRAATPDLDDFSAIETSAAQEAAFSILIALEQCLDLHPRHSVRIARFSRDTLDMLAQIQLEIDPQEPELEEKIETFGPFREELRKQEEDLRKLESQPRLEGTFLAEFRDFAAGRTGLVPDPDG